MPGTPRSGAGSSSAPISYGARTHAISDDAGCAVSGASAPGGQGAARLFLLGLARSSDGRPSPPKLLHQHAMT